MVAWLDVEGVSQSPVSTLCGQLRRGFEQWQNRDLTEHRILYLFGDEMPGNRSGRGCDRTAFSRLAA